MPRRLIGIHVVTCGLSPLQFAISQIFSQLFKTAIAMISYVDEGWPHLLGDLWECLALKKVQSERLSLIFGEAFNDLFPSVPAEQPFDRLIVFRPRICFDSGSRTVSAIPQA